MRFEGEAFTAPSRPGEPPKKEEPAPPLQQAVPSRKRGGGGLVALLALGAVGLGIALAARGGG